ncbi:MAG: hypothetical protein IT488_04135 [Gammaproteobacteria bacterium]|nr:hypothetical protein [Gammaproteobacteria bacterium]
MFKSSILRTWVIAFVCCTIVAAVVYGLMIPGRGNSFEDGMAYFLLPGISLYTLLNGSLLFGGGFGEAGNFFVIGLSSALAWSLVAVLAVQGFSRLRRTKGGAKGGTLG